MLGGRPFVVSLPATELFGVGLPGSVFGSEQLLTAPLSDELRRAIAVLEHNSPRGCPPPSYIARPEIFTHGELLDWLRQKIGGVQDHICVSDGTTIRLVQGLKNHVYFHGLCRMRDTEALGRLERRVPGFFKTITSQINTALRFHAAPHILHISTEYAEAPDLARVYDPEIYRFYLGRYAIEDSVARILKSAKVDFPSTRYQKLVYIPITSAAVADELFCKAVSATIAAAILDPSACVIIRLSVEWLTNKTLADRIAEVLNAIRWGDAAIPTILAGNILLATDDLDLKRLAKNVETLNVILHDSFDFWRYPKGQYEAVASIRIVARRRRLMPAAHKALLTAALGEHWQITWSANLRDADLSKERYVSAPDFT